MQRDSASVLDIINAARRVEQLTSGMDFAAFEVDVRTQLAIIQLIVIMGEAVKRLSPAFRAHHVDVPWKEIAGMRDVVTHHSDDVDLGEVWQVVVHDAPALLARLLPLVPNVEAPTDEV